MAASAVLLQPIALVRFEAYRTWTVAWPNAH